MITRQKMRMHNVIPICLHPLYAYLIMIFRTKRIFSCKTLLLRYNVFQIAYLQKKHDKCAAPFPLRILDRLVEVHVGKSELLQISKKTNENKSNSSFFLTTKLCSWLSCVLNGTTSVGNIIRDMHYIIYINASQERKLFIFTIENVCMALREITRHKWETNI